MAQRKRKKKKRREKKARREQPFSLGPISSVTQTAAELLEAGDVEAAIALLEPMVARQPDVVEYWALLATAYSMRGDHVIALRHFERMRRAGLQEVALDFSLAMEYASLGYPILAKRMFAKVPRKFLTLDPHTLEGGRTSDRKPRISWLRKLMNWGSFVRRRRKSYWHYHEPSSVIGRLRW
ncbi:MAG TPA: hypothetical protein G4O02_13150 [Caldilineae bacterium]|nr:hypothetical protein [Caldilineae bacterium]